jgi:hypothetical protein
MIALGFRTKLLLAMMLLVAGVTGATIYVTEAQIQKTYERVMNAQIQGQIRNFSDLQAERLGSVKRRCLELNNSVRLRAALEEMDPAVLYDRELTLEQLHDVLSGMGDEGAAGKGGGANRADFLCFLGAYGQLLPPPPPAASLLPPA